MITNSSEILHIKNEKIQIVLRMIMITLLIFTLPSLNQESPNLVSFFSLRILDVLISIILLNILYYFIILKAPLLFYKQRIIYIAVMDVLSSAYVVYVLGPYSAYYPALFLWYSIGYSVRYGNSVGFPVYVVTIISWIFLLTTSSYWIENISLGIGWLIAFIIIPLYHFYLLKRLQDTLAKLHQNLDKSEHQSNHDVLTKIPNRLHFEKRLDNILLTKKKFALFFIDLDGFKKINDTFGHQVGDKVLVTTSQRIMSFNNFAARLGGDEFVSIVEFEDDKYIKEYAKELTHLLSSECEDKNIIISTSIGIAIYPDDATTVFDLKKKSDIAMYTAKKNGKNTFCFYSSTL